MIDDAPAPIQIANDAGLEAALSAAGMLAGSDGTGAQARPGRRGVPLLHSGSEAPHDRLAGGAGALGLQPLEDSASTWSEPQRRSFGERNCRPTSLSGAADVVR
jgi:hypothetical protein